jgi:hypothetical protein
MSDALIHFVVKTVDTNTRIIHDVWLSNIYALSAPDEGYSWNVL